MATIARTGAARAGASLIFLLGAAVFINYVDRGAIAVAAPVMKGELRLSATTFGLAVSAFFWVYAPVQLVVGWLCDRFSVYKLIAAGLILWAGSTLLMGFVGGFLSLLLLRVLLGVGESIAFPGTSKIIARHIPVERRGLANAAVAAGIAAGPAIGTLVGGLMVAWWGWRPMFIVFGIATLAWLIPWQRLVPTISAPADLPKEPRVPVAKLIGKWPLWAMSVGHCTSNYVFYFLLAWLPLYLVQSRGFTIPEMTLLATLGYAVQAVAALIYGDVSDRWTRSGRSEAAIRRSMMVASQALSAIAVFGLVYAGHALPVAILLCLAGAATAALSLNLYAIAQMFAGPKAAGTWVGVQNAFGNSSGIFQPIIAGIIIDRAGYASAFYLTSAIAAFGALWWAWGVPQIREVEFE
jgi:MFS family permease